MDENPASAPAIGNAVTGNAVICNRRGLHARAAAKFVTMAEQYNATIEVSYHGQTVPAQSIMGLMMLGAGLGATIELCAQGIQAEEALAALTALVQAGFHEQG